ncbi:Mitochondrial ribosomal protein L45 [Paragonimus heterotremus]|uniref:Large ribosomal subunit protein mL45 n=1 Tax=Paragonimus heterotremus TaxID=100268 RepID=A0A8J4T2X0_9TREM|nr:Mitochondrial ribosomal protein L45 [Paragonimus heterotremus]
MSRFMLCLTRSTPLYTQPTRFARHKPWIPKFRLLRQLQPWDGPIDLNKDRPPTGFDESPAALRARLRRNGMLPPLIFQDSPINIGHSGQVTDPYVPPDGDGRASLLSLKRATSELEDLLKKGKSYRETLKIRKYEPTFDPKTFVNEAEAIYKEAQELLQRFTDNESRLFELVTEKAFAEMTNGLRFRTLRWQFIASIEPPRVVRIRTQEMLTKDNLFAQVTVRFHTQQVLAIFDRFGRLLFGNPTIPVDVLEYVVLEKHITDEYGRWRVHAKIQSPSNPTPPRSYIPTRRLSPEELSVKPKELGASVDSSSPVPHVAE